MPPTPNFYEILLSKQTGGWLKNANWLKNDTDFFRFGLGRLSLILDAQSHLHKRFKDLIKDAQRNGFQDICKPEPLKGDLSGCWSRRVNQEHHLIYFQLDSPVGNEPHQRDKSVKRVGNSLIDES